VRATGAALLLAVCLWVLTAAAAGEAPASTVRGDSYSLTLSAEGKGHSCTVTLTVINTDSAKALTAAVRDVALDGECMGVRDILTVPAGQTNSLTLRWRRPTLTALTAVEAAVRLTAEGGAGQDELIAVYPLGPENVKRTGHYDDAGGTVALDSEEATVILYRGAQTDDGYGLDVWLYNKTDDIARYRLEGVMADGRTADAALLSEVLPRCGAFARITLPVKGEPADIRMVLAGYLMKNGSSPVFRETLEYAPAAPVAVPTLVPAVTKPPVIGTVTIRKSGSVNVREGDSTDARKVGSAKAGHSYPCLAISENGWYLIRLDDGTEGYVTNTLTTLKKD